MSENEFYKDLKENGTRMDAVRAIAKHSLKQTLNEIRISKAKLSRRSCIAASTVAKVTRGDAVRLDSAKTIATALKRELE